MGPAYPERADVWWKSGELNIRVRGHFETDGYNVWVAADTQQPLTYHVMQARVPGLPASGACPQPYDWVQVFPMRSPPGAITMVDGNGTHRVNPSQQ